MERAMLTRMRDRDPLGERNRAPPRWVFPSREIEDWARQARAEALSELVGWLARQARTVAMRWTARYQAWRTRREAVRELQSLDNRMLRDIGVGRSEIEWRVAGGDDSQATPLPAAKPCAAASATRSRGRETQKRAA